MAEELDPMSGLVGKEKTTEPIKTPKAKKATTPPPPVTPNPFAELGLLGRTFEDKTGGFTEEGFTSTGIANTMQGQYGSYLKDGFDLRYSDGENTAGQNQGAWTQVGSGVLRAAAKVGIEVLKMPGYIGGMGGSAIDGMFGTNLTDSDNFVGSVADNAWINAFESLDEGVKNALPVYMTDAVKNGSLWDNISSTSFWASEGADGLGYMASMFVPGGAVKALGAGAKVAGGMAKGLSGTSKLASKFIPFVKPTNFHGASKALFNMGVKGSSIDLAAATGMSTMFEAAAEAGGTMDHLKESLLPKLQSGEITQEEYDSTIANAGKDIFNANLGILIGPNLLMNKMLLGRFKPTKSLNIKDGVVQSAKQTTKQQLGTIGKTLATNVASEGLFEEGLQGTVEGMITEKAEKGERYDLDEFFGDLGGAYMDMLGSTEGQKAIFLGSVMGGGMGIASHLKQRKANAKFEDGVAGAMAEHTNTLYDFADIYKTDNQGKPVLNKETNRPEIDPIKFDKSLTGLAEMLELTETLSELNEAGKKDAYDAMLGSVHLNLAIAFADLENGEQGFREILQDRKAFFDMNNPDQKFDGENISSEEYITKIESLAKQAKKDKDVYNEFITPNLQLNKENEFSEEELSEEEFVGEAEAFQSKAEAAFINANHTIRSIDKSLSKVNAQISELERVLNTEEQSTEEGSPKESGMISTLKEKKKNLTEQKKRIAKQIDAFSSPENIRNEFKKHLDKLVKIKNVIKSETEKEKKREEEGGHPLDPKVDNAKDEAVLDAVLAQAKQDNSITPELIKRVKAKRDALKGAIVDKDLSPEQSQNRKEKESITEARSEFDNITDEDIENAVGLDAFMQTEEENTPAKTKEEPVVASPLDALTGLKVNDSLSSNEETESADTTEDTKEDVSAASAAVSDAIVKRKEKKEAAAEKKDETIKSTPVVGQVEDDFSSSDPYTSVNKDMVLYKVTSKGLILAHANAPIMSFEQADAAGLKYNKNQRKKWGVLLDKNFNPIDSPSKKDSDYKVDQDFVNSGGVKPGDSISYSVRPDSNWNVTGKATSANLLIELKHDKSGKVIGILPAYNAKKGHEESFKELRDSIYAEYLAHDKNNGELTSKTKTKVEEVRPGRVYSTGTRSNPLNVLTAEQPLILTTVSIVDGVLAARSNDIGQFGIDSQDIYTDNLIAKGRTYMLIQAPNGSWIPYQVNPTKLSSVEGTKEKIEAILDSITSENFLEKRRELSEIVHIEELKHVEYGKAKSSDYTFGIPGKKLHGLPLNKFKEYLFDELKIMDRYFSVDTKQVNNPGYNQMLAKEGRIKTDLNPMKHFHSATVRVSKTAVSAETKAVEKKTVTEPTKAEKKEDIASLPSTKVEVVTASQTSEVEAKKADIERRRQEGKEIQLFEDKDKKGRIYTFFSTTKEKDGLTKTTFTFNRSDKPSTQRNKGSVPTDIALGNKYTIPKQTKNADGSMSNQIPEDTIVHSVLEIREADGKVGATVMFQDKNDSTKRWKVDIVLEINAKYDAELDALQPTQPTSEVEVVSYKGAKYSVDFGSGTITNLKTGKVLEGGVTSSVGQAVVGLAIDQQESATQTSKVESKKTSNLELIKIQKEKSELIQEKARRLKALDNPAIEERRKEGNTKGAEILEKHKNEKSKKLDEEYDSRIEVLSQKELEITNPVEFAAQNKIKNAVSKAVKESTIGGQGVISNYFGGQNTIGKEIISSDARHNSSIYGITSPFAMQPQDANSKVKIHETPPKSITSPVKGKTYITLSYFTNQDTRGGLNVHVVEIDSSVIKHLSIEKLNTLFSNFVDNELFEGKYSRNSFNDKLLQKENYNITNFVDKRIREIINNSIKPTQQTSTAGPSTKLNRKVRPAGLKKGGTGLNLKSKEDNKGEAYKAKTKSTEAQITKEEIAWFKKNFPQVDIQVLEDLRSVTAHGVDAWGMFKNAMVSIHEKAPEGTVFHEAFHAVYRMMISPEQRSALFAEAAERFDFDQKEYDALRKAHPTLSENALTMLYYEEKLADSYQLYQTNKGLTKSLGSKIQSLFKRIFDFFMGTKNNMLNIDQMFDKMSRGGFKNADIVRSTASINPVYSVRKKWSSNKVEARVNLVNDLMLKTVKSEYMENPEDYKELQKTLSRVLTPKNPNGSVYNQVATDLINDAYDAQDEGNITTSEELFDLVDEMFTYEITEEGGIEFKSYKPFMYDLTNNLRKFDIKVNATREQFEEQGEQLDEDGNLIENWQQNSVTVNPKANLSGELKMLFSQIPDGKDDLGYDKYHDGNKVFNTLLSLITNSDSVSTMLEKLDNAKENHSFINTINSKLISDPKLKSQLFQIAQKSNNNAKVVFQTITFDKEGNQVTESRLVNANENTVEQVITDNLYNQFSSSNILDENLEVKEEGLVTNDIEKLDELLTFFKRPANRSLESASEEQVKELYSILNKHNLVLDKAHIEKLGKNKKNFVKLITSYKGLLTIINKGTNPFISEKKALKRITSLIQLVEPNYFQSSYRNMANETVQSVVAPNFLSKVLTKLSGSNVSEDTVADHREEVFENLRNSDAFLSTAPILRPRGAKNSYVADNNGVFEFATLSGIRKKGITKGKSYTSMTKADLAESLLTTFHNSGSASHAWYSLPILSDAPTMTVVKLKKLNHADIVADLHFVAHQEYQRILDVKAKMKDGGTLIKNRDSENGLKFHFITNLAESDFTAANSRDLIKAKIESFLAKQVEEFSKEVQSFELSKNISSPASIKSFVENDFLAKTQLISLTSGDVAYYKSTVDFFKRNKQINSPGMYINEAGTFTYTGEDTKLQGKTINVRPTFDSVFLTDTTPAAPFRADLKEALIKSGMSETKAETKAKNYDKVEESDAQAYITLDRWVEIQIGMGRYDNAMHESVSRLKSGKSTTDDISLVMQPIKPFYFGHVNIEGSVVPMQNKNSEYVLLPELANKSTKLKKLLDFMEENKVSSAQFESAVKVGLHSKVEVENLTSKTPVVSLKNSDYRVQMETPAHFSDAQSLLGSQIRKLILGDLNLEAMYGDKMSGQDLINKVDEILSKTISEAMKETLEEVTDPTTLNNILKEEVLNRDLGERYLKALELDENGDPTLQYYHPFLSQQAQSLFNSVFKTAIAKTKMNGGSLYNLSSFGFTKDLTIKFDKKTGGIDHVEAMVPASAIFGKKIPKEFLNEFGEIDITKVPEKMLRGMSYRIPTEDKYSMFNIKVVGFLPNNAAIMLPTGVTEVAGLDFDIDKMYNMFYNHKNGIPVESGMDSKAARDNYILDLYTLVKQHPSSLEASMTPGGFQTFESVVKDIKKRKGMAEDNLNPASVSSNLEIFARNMAGKALIGIFANHNASHAILQHGDIEIIDGLINFDGDTNSSISEVTDLKGGLITRNIAEFLAAVVDNAKDPLAGFSNVNTYTADVVAMFLHNGRSIETALAFMNQPIIIDYVERYFNYGASKQAEAKALEELKVEKPEDLKKLPSQYSTSTLLRGINGKTKEAYTNAEQAILTDFLKFKMVAGEVSNLVNAVKTGDSGTGPTMGHNEAKIRQWNRVKMESKYIAGHTDLMNDNTKSFVNYYEVGINQANAAINEVAKFPFNSGIYVTSKDSIESNVASVNLNVNDLNNINDSVMSYIAASHEFFNTADVNEVLKNLPGRLAKYQKENPNSEFSKLTKYLTVKVDPNTSTRVIEYSTIANDSLQQDNSSKAWESMLLSDNVEDKQMALDLFKYNFGRSGFKFTRSSFAHIAPVEIYDYIPGFKNHIDAKLNEFSYDHSIVSTEAFTNQYVANNFANLNYIPIFAYNVKSVGKGVNTSENVITNKQGQVTSVTFDKEEGRQFTKYDPAIKASYALPFIKLNTSVKVGGKNKRVSTLFKHNVEASTGTTEIVYDAVITPKEGTTSYEIDKVDFEFKADVKSEASTQLEKFDINDENNAISLEDFLNRNEGDMGSTEDPFKQC